MKKAMLVVVVAVGGFGMLLSTGIIMMFFVSDNSASTACVKTGGDSAQTATPNPMVPVAAVEPGKAGSYSGASLDSTQVGNARAIADTAAKLFPANQIAYAQVIGITTAMGESTLTVIDHGDIAGPDSRGLFQQRAAGWGPLSQRMDPVGSATSFFNHLSALPMWTQMTVTQAAHKVQINKDPNFYSKFEPIGRALATAFSGKPAVSVVTAAQPIPSAPACATSGASTNVVNVALAGPGGGPAAQAAVAWSLAHLGLAYSQANRYGPSSYDCSSFTMTAWKSAGVTIPGIADLQYHWATPVPTGSELPGDLAFPKSEINGGTVGHVVLVIANDGSGLFSIASEHHSGTVSSVDHGKSEADYIFGRVH
jgi:cell wall-associated NlpC family hydrolase